MKNTEAKSVQKVRFVGNREMPDFEVFPSSSLGATANFETFLKRLRQLIAGKACRFRSFFFQRFVTTKPLLYLT